jgi:hypothetical protein
MVGRRLARMTGRVARNARDSQFVRTLRDEYRKGRDGETGETGEIGDATASDADVEAVAVAMRGVDWSRVKAATAARTGAAAKRMKTMARDVDWAKVQSGAAVVSSALIAAVASGQIPVKGPVTGPIARAIINDGNLAARVNAVMARSGTTPPDFRQVIDTTATEPD